MSNSDEITCGVRQSFKIGDIIDHPLYGKIQINQWLGSIWNIDHFEHHVRAIVIESNGVMEQLLSP